MVYRRGDVYYIDTIVDGKRIHKSTGCRDLAAAEAVADRVRADAEKSLIGGRLLLKDAIEDLFIARWSKTADGEQVYQRLQKVLDLMGNVDLKSIKAADVNRLKTRLSEGRSVATVNRHLAPLKTLLRVAANEWEAIDRVPMVKLDAETNRRERVISQDEERMVVDALRRTRPDIADMVEVMVDTAIRPKELRLTSDAMVDMEAKVIRLTGDITKNHRPRVVPMTDRVHRIMGSRLGNGHAFPISRWTLDRAFKSARLSLGIGDETLIPYLCRHTAITRMLERGVDVYTVGQIAGHSTSGMTERYGHLCLDAKRAAIDTLNKRGEDHV
jgi:integrase